MELDTAICRTAVYLTGDPGPVMTTLSVEQVAALIADCEIAAGRGPCGFVRLPLVEAGRGDALVRPTAIAAVMPDFDEDD